MTATQILVGPVLGHSSPATPTSGPTRAGHRRRHRHGVGRGPDVARSAPTAAAGRLVVLTALGGPASMVGFDLARSFNPRGSAARSGSSTWAGSSPRCRPWPWASSSTRSLRAGPPRPRRVPPGDGRPVPVLGAGGAADLAVPAQGDRPPARSPSRGATGAPRRQSVLPGISADRHHGGPASLWWRRGGTFGGVRRRAPRSCPSRTARVAPEATGAQPPKRGQHTVTNR